MMRKFSLKSNLSLQFQFTSTAFQLPAMHCCKEPTYSVTSWKAQGGCWQVPYRAKCITGSLYSVNAVYHGNCGLFYKMHLFMPKLLFPRETAAILSSNQRAHIFCQQENRGKKRENWVKKTQPSLPKCLFKKKDKKKKKPTSSAVLELGHPPPVYPTNSTIRLLCKNSHIYK